MFAYIPTLLDKIRSICKECFGMSIPSKCINQQLTKQLIQQYINKVEEIKNYIIDTRIQEEQHRKLQTLLQKQESQLRKHIGLEHQLKLYVDSLKNQVEQIENQRIELLENSKEIIKQLKKQNQKLYEQLKSSKQNQHQFSHSLIKDRNSNSQKYKTQLTQRPRNSNSGGKTHIESKKKYPFQNYTILTNLNSKKKDKSPIKYTKDKLQQQVTKQKNLEKKKHHVSVFRIGDSKQKKKKQKINRSTNSVSSLDLKQSSRK